MKKNYVIDIDNFLKDSPLWPTHRHKPEFWEMLGRTIGSFGFLEEVLARAIYVISGAKAIPNKENIDEEFEAWVKYLVKALSDPLAGLIDKYEESLKNNSSFSVRNLEELIKGLKELKVWRNILCHASWKQPNLKGESVPFFVNRKGDAVSNPVDITVLEQVMRNTTELTCLIINSVTSNDVTPRLGPRQIIQSQFSSSLPHS